MISLEKFYNLLIFSVTSLYIIMLFPLSLVRISGNYAPVIMILDIFLLTFIAFGLLRVAIPTTKLLYAPVFLFLSILFIVYIFAIGLWNDNPNVVANLRFFMLALAIYFAVAGTTFYYKIISSNTLWYLALASHVLGYIFYYFFLKGTVYPGIGVQSIGYAGIFFFLSGQPILGTIAIVLLIVEQKRSLLLSFSLTILVIYFIRNKSKLSLVDIIKSVLVFFIIGSILLLLVANLEPSSIVNRINLLNPFSKDFDLFLGSSGRLGEIVSFFESNSIQSILVGLGSGFSYIWDVGYVSGSNGEIKYYFHLSFLNYLAAGGVFGMIYFSYIISLYRKPFDLPVSKKSRNIMIAFFIFSITQSFFGFNTAIDPILWITILGPLALKHYQHKSIGSVRYHHHLRTKHSNK